MQKMLCHMIKKVDILVYSIPVHLYDINHYNVTEFTDVSGHKKTCLFLRMNNNGTDQAVLSLCFFLTR